MFTIKKTAQEIHIEGLTTTSGREIHSITKIPSNAETGHTYDNLQHAFDEARMIGRVCRTCAMAATMILNRK